MCRLYLELSVCFPLYREIICFRINVLSPEFPLFFLKLKTYAELFWPCLENMYYLVLAICKKQQFRRLDGFSGQLIIGHQGNRPFGRVFFSRGRKSEELPHLLLYSSGISPYFLTSILICNGVNVTFYS